MTEQCRTHATQKHASAASASDAGTVRCLPTQGLGRGYVPGYVPGNVPGYVALKQRMCDNIAEATIEECFVRAPTCFGA